MRVVLARSLVTELSSRGIQANSVAFLIPGIRYETNLFKIKFGRWILGTWLRPAVFPLIVDSSEDSTVSKEVVIVSSSVACARVVWGRYWYSNAAFGWCVWSVIAVVAERPILFKHQLL